MEFKLPPSPVTSKKYAVCKTDNENLIKALEFIRSKTQCAEAKVLLTLLIPAADEFCKQNNL